MAVNTTSIGGSLCVPGKVKKLGDGSGGAVLTEAGEEGRSGAAELRREMLTSAVVLGLEESFGDNGAVVLRSRRSLT